jgi:hypothetical protein
MGNLFVNFGCVCAIVDYNAVRQSWMMGVVLGDHWGGYMEECMRSPHVDDLVRLTQDIPELSLNRGELGIVRSTWFAPSVAYEVEFHAKDTDFQTRALLLAEQVEVEEAELATTGV